jgi:SMI1 / KNR4 family (SUKH-1)
MNNTKRRKWDILLERLSIDDQWRRVASLEDFVSVEQKMNIKISEDYQYFCQILGAGRLDNFLDIDCLDEEQIIHGQDTAEYMIEKINYGVQHRTSMILTELESAEYYKDRADDRYVELLKSSLIFGNYNDEYVVFWDLRTYNSNDDSYDIYWYSQDVPDGDIPVKIGRDFTDFICDFCYGQLASQLIPEVFPESPRQVEYTFYCG